LGKTHNSHLHLQVLAGAVAIILNLLFPEFIYEVRYWVLGVVILVIGMPHGALDHIIAFKAFEKDKSPKNQFLFYAFYLTVMLIYGILWIYFPLASFILFLIITLYHFGQADAERFSFNGGTQKILLYARGFTVVGLILFGSDPYYSSQIIAEVTGFSFSDYAFQVLVPKFYTLFFALIYPVFFFVISTIRKDIHQRKWFSLDAAIVPMLFSLCDPIFAFAIYFGCWHSFNHTQTMLHFLNNRGMDVNFRWFYRNTFLYSVLSYAGLLVLYLLLKAFGDPNLLIALLFIVISILTLPHMVVVERMYNHFFPEN
jgi:Brp/Blh family beta-carotene 15,15'-monooxygenase